MTHTSPHYKKLLMVAVLAAFALVGTLLLSNSSAGPKTPNDPNFPIADTNGDNTVNIFDLSYMLNRWNTNNTTADFTSDGLVNIFDLSYLLAQWQRVDSVGGNPNALYVAVNGNDSNNGRSEGSAKRTIQAAVSLAVPGETVYVKAGTYNGEQVVFQADGSPGNLITIEGYKTVPGDRPTLPDFGDGSSMQPSEMPVLDGGNRGSGIAVTTGSSDYVVVRNLMITQYVGGVWLGNSVNATVDSVYVKDVGVNNKDSYSGTGIKTGTSGTGGIIRNSVVVNAGAESFGLYSDNYVLENSKVYGSYTDGNANAPDYYVIVNGSNNTIRDSYIQRVGDPWHLGHGFGVKGTGSNNLFENNVAEGIGGASYYARHRAAVDNTFVGNTAQNTYNVPRIGFSIEIRDGADRNTFEDHYAEDMWVGVAFSDTTEDGYQQWSGRDNSIKDSQFINMTDSGIRYTRWSYTDSVSSNNTFDNVTIDGAPRLFHVEAIGSNNVLKNSTIRNVPSYALYGPGRDASHLGMTITNVSGSGNGFALP